MKRKINIPNLMSRFEREILIIRLYIKNRQIFDLSYIHFTLKIN